MEVESIHGVEPWREGEYPLYYKVGVDGVTDIDRHNFGDGFLFSVFKGDRLHSHVFSQALSEVIYKEEDKNE